MFVVEPSHTKNVTRVNAAQCETPVHKNTCLVRTDACLGAQTRMHTHTQTPKIKVCQRVRRLSVVALTCVDNMQL